MEIQSSVGLGALQCTSRVTEEWTPIEGLERRAGILGPGDLKLSIQERQAVNSHLVVPRDPEE